ncbi:unnamed protein product [Gongylonema pulchrum]|uniref:Uncharacterized protein n=1 Tax=Gongylonema pulchrum TaxID=637853 RepID=A0A183DZU5_9BILA|nr:unnamed protein product [Gongylonema pulchrum]
MKKVIVERKEMGESGRLSSDVANTLIVDDPEKDGYEPPPRHECRRFYDVASVVISLLLYALSEHLDVVDPAVSTVESEEQKEDNAARKELKHKKT